MSPRLSFHQSTRPPIPFYSETDSTMDQKTNYAIRPLTSADQEMLWEMLYLSLYVPEGAPPFARAILDQPEIARYAAGWGREGDIGFVAADGSGRVLGAAWLRHFSDDDRGFGWIDDSTPELGIAVVEECRGRGIGTALLRHLLDHARSTPEQVSLSVSRDNPAVRLYRRLGFEIVGDDGDSITMVKKLTRE